MQSGIEAWAGGGASDRSDGVRSEVGAPVGGGGQPFIELEWAGARVLVHRAAPDPGSHAPALPDAEIARRLASVIEERERRIESLRHELAKDGVPADRLVAAIVYDTERAPRTTNRRQLAEIGIEVPASVDGLPADEVRQQLWTIVYGLARLGIFLLGTDHLDDRALLSRLCERILDDEVGDVPPTPDMSEFIDLGEGAFEKAQEQLAEIFRSAAATEVGCSDGLRGPFESADPAASIDDDDDPSELAIAKGASSWRPAASAGRDERLPRPARTIWPEPI